MSCSVGRALDRAASQRRRPDSGRIGCFRSVDGEGENRPQQQPLRRRLGDELSAFLDGEGASKFRGNCQAAADAENKRGPQRIDPTRAEDHPGRRAVLLSARANAAPRQRAGRRRTSFRSGMRPHATSFIASCRPPPSAGRPSPVYGPFAGSFCGPSFAIRLRISLSFTFTRAAFSGPIRSMIFWPAGSPSSAGSAYS